jgi:hypothetical protein
MAFVAIGGGLYWLWESSTCGRCWFSQHLAPVVIVSNLVLAIANSKLNRK